MMVIGYFGFLVACGAFFTFFKRHRQTPDRYTINVAEERAEFHADQHEMRAEIDEARGTYHVNRGSW